MVRNPAFLFFYHSELSASYRYWTNKNVYQVFTYVYQIIYQVNVF